MDDAAIIVNGLTKRLVRLARPELDLETYGVPLFGAIGVLALWAATSLSLAGWRERRQEL